MKIIQSLQTDRGPFCVSESFSPARAAAAELHRWASSWSASMHATRFLLALAVSFGGIARLDGQPPAPRGVRPEDFAEVKTLGQAVELIQGRLKQDGKLEYANLISEQRVRDSVRSAVRSYEAMVDDLEKKRPGSKAYFLNEVKPLCLKVAENEWSPRCSFFSLYTLRDRRQVHYDGLGLRLRIETAGAKSEAFALPVVDLYFGRFAE